MSSVHWLMAVFFIKLLIKNTTVPLTLCGLVTSYSIDEEGTSLVHVMTCRLSAPSHYPNQCWLVVEWTLKNKFRWNMNQNTAIYIQEMHLKMLSTKRRTFCSGLMLSYQCRNPHVKDKTVFNMGIPYLAKTVLILNQGPVSILPVFQSMCRVKPEQVFGSQRPDVGELTDN